MRHAIPHACPERAPPGPTLPHPLQHPAQTGGQPKQQVQAQAPRTVQAVCRWRPLPLLLRRLLLALRCWQRRAVELGRGSGGPPPRRHHAILRCCCRRGCRRGVSGARLVESQACCRGRCRQERGQAGRQAGTCMSSIPATAETHSQPRRPGGTDSQAGGGCSPALSCPAGSPWLTARRPMLRPSAPPPAGASRPTPPRGAPELVTPAAAGSARWCGCWDSASWYRVPVVSPGPALAQLVAWLSSGPAPAAAGGAGARWAAQRAG